MKNVGVEGGTVSGGVGRVGYANGVGGVAGYLGNNYVKITNCYSTADVISAGGNVGGVVGRVNTGGVEDCYSASSKVSGSSNVGGVVGYAANSVINCFSTATVSGSSYVGGVAGTVRGDVLECYSKAMSVIGSESYVGGIVGVASGKLRPEKPCNFRNGCTWE